MKQIVSNRIMKNNHKQKEKLMLKQIKNLNKEQKIIMMRQIVWNKI